MLSTNFSAPRFLLFLALAAVFIVIMTGNVRYTNSDPQLTLLTSQSIAEHGTLKLDAYKNALPEQQFADGNWKYFYNNGSPMYYYPIGTSVLCTPVVAVARKFGMDMSIMSHDFQLQVIIAALLCVLIVYLVYRMARLFAEEMTALLWTLLLFFGTTFISTLGTALWSFGFELVFLLPVLTEMAEVELKKRDEIRPVRTGLLLFMAWFCRPSALAFIIVFFAWMLLRRSYRKGAFVLIPMLSGLLLFVLFSFQAYNKWLPPYYDPFHWNGMEHLHGSFYTLLGLLFSPARGLFVFTPLLLLPFVFLFSPELRKNRFYLLLLGWFVLHTLMLTRNAGWWGGWSYGPRLFTDLLPAFALLLFMALPVLQKSAGTRFVKISGGFAFAAALFGIYTHTMQGLYNNATKSWNDQPNIDQHTDFYAFNWRYPQFLASDQQNMMKRRDFELRRELEVVVKELPAGAHLLAGSPDAELRSICMGISKIKDEFKNVQVYNDLYDLEQSGAKTFYVTNDQSGQLTDSTRYRIESPANAVSLGGFLKGMEDDLVLISVKDEGTNALSPASKQYLRDHGAHIDSLKYRQGYVLVIGHGKVAQEFFDTGSGAETTVKDANDRTVKVISRGMDNGNVSSIMVGSDELSPGMRGFNVVVISDRGAIVDAANFDTHASDRRTSRVLKVMRLK